MLILLPHSALEDNRLYFVDNIAVPRDHDPLDPFAHDRVVSRVSDRFATVPGNAGPGMSNVLRYNFRLGSGTLSPHVKFSRVIVYDSECNLGFSNCILSRFVAAMPKRSLLVIGQDPSTYHKRSVKRCMHLRELVNQALRIAPALSQRLQFVHRPEHGAGRFNWPYLVAKHDPYPIPGHTPRRSPWPDPELVASLERPVNLDTCVDVLFGGRIWKKINDREDCTGDESGPDRDLEALFVDYGVVWWSLASASLDFADSDGLAADGLARDYLFDVALQCLAVRRLPALGADNAFPECVKVAVSYHDFGRFAALKKLVHDISNSIQLRLGHSIGSAQARVGPDIPKFLRRALVKDPKMIYILLRDDVISESDHGFQPKCLLSQPPASDVAAGCGPSRDLHVNDNFVHGLVYMYLTSRSFGSLVTPSPFAMVAHFIHASPFNAKVLSIFRLLWKQDCSNILVLTSDPLYQQ